MITAAMLSVAMIAGLQGRYEAHVPLIGGPISETVLVLEFEQVNGNTVAWLTSLADAAVHVPVRQAVLEAFILVGSGVDEANAKKLLSMADGAIVGTSLRRDGLVTNRLDPERVKGMAEIIRNMG